jgi:hypothetical protein
VEYNQLVDRVDVVGVSASLSSSQNTSIEVPVLFVNAFVHGCSFFRRFGPNIDAISLAH